MYYLIKIEKDQQKIIKLIGSMELITTKENMMKEQIEININFK